MTIKYYKHISKERVYLMACLYDLQSKLKFWAKPFQDVNGDWFLQKPDELECSHIICAFPEVEIVEHDDIEFVDPF